MSSQIVSVESSSSSPSRPQSPSPTLSSDHVRSTDRRSETSISRPKRVRDDENQIPGSTLQPILKKRRLEASELTDEQMNQSFIGSPSNELRLKQRDNFLRQVEGVKKRRLEEPGSPSNESTLEQRDNFLGQVNGVKRRRLGGSELTDEQMNQSFVGSQSYEPRLEQLGEPSEQLEEAKQRRRKKSNPPKKQPKQPRIASKSNGLSLEQEVEFFKQLEKVKQRCIDGSKLIEKQPEQRHVNSPSKLLRRKQRAMVNEYFRQANEVSPTPSSEPGQDFCAETVSEGEEPAFGSYGFRPTFADDHSYRKDYWDTEENEGQDLSPHDSENAPYCSPYDFENPPNLNDPWTVKENEGQDFSPYHHGSQPVPASPAYPTPTDLTDLRPESPPPNAQVQQEQASESDEDQDGHNPRTSPTPPLISPSTLLASSSTPTQLITDSELLPGSSQESILESEILDDTASLAAASEQIAALERENERLWGKNDELQLETLELEIDLEDSRSQNQQLNSRIEALEAEIRRLRKEMRNMQKPS